MTDVWPCILSRLCTVSCETSSKPTVFNAALSTLLLFFGCRDPLMPEIGHLTMLLYMEDLLQVFYWQFPLKCSVDIVSKHCRLFDTNSFGNIVVKPARLHHTGNRTTVKFIHFVCTVKPFIHLYYLIINVLINVPYHLS